MDLCSSSIPLAPTTTSTIDPPPSPPPEFGVLVPPFPDDVAVNILARVPRIYHSVLSAVSKPIRSLLSSPDFFTTRSRLNITENQFYLWLGPGFNRPEYSWFIVHRDPKPNRNSQMRRHFRLVQLPPFPVPKLTEFAIATVGPKIYVIGGLIDRVRSSNVWVLDCRFHTWERGPSMRMARHCAETTVLDRKIYVTNGVARRNIGAHWAEVLDPLIGRWEAIPTPDFNPQRAQTYEVGCRFCVKVGSKDFMFDPKKKTREVFEGKLVIDHMISYYVGEEVLYGRARSCQYLVSVHDRRNGVWKDLKGFFLKGTEFCPQLVYMGGDRFLMVWGQNGRGTRADLTTQKWGIWCGEIMVKKKKKNNGGDEEWWAEVVHSSEKILSLPGSAFCLTERVQTLDFFCFFNRSVCFPVSL